VRSGYAKKNRPDPHPILFAECIFKLRPHVIPTNISIRLKSDEGQTCFFVRLAMEMPLLTSLRIWQLVTYGLETLIAILQA
jgi:hypothetical protein